MEKRSVPEAQSTPRSRCVIWKSILLGITSVKACDCHLAAFDFPRLLLPYFQRLDNGSIEPMQLPLEAAVFPPTTILFSCVNCHMLALRPEALGGIQGMRVYGDDGYTFDVIRASVSIYAFYVVTIAAKFARRHTAYVLECCQLILIRFVVMIMCTWVVRTVVS